jgi:tetratricopeptide (TPR) repeat protein
MTSSGSEDGIDWAIEEFRRHERARSEALRGAAGERVPRLPRYEVRERLGEGATAVVYKAWDRELKRAVALKVLREAAGTSPVARERFRREAQAAAGLRHPNVVAIFDAGEEEGVLYLVLELIDGRSLAALLAEGRPDRGRAVSLLEKAARGVAAAHAQGIVHRDLKPANILLDTSGEPKVGDFGLVHVQDSTRQLTRTGTTLGTPCYMAPEQVDPRLGEVRPAADVYALGAILYEALVGRPPHVAENVMELYSKIVREEPAPPRALDPRIPGDLETVVLTALAKEPSRRYAGAAELAEDLRRVSAGEPIAARRPGLAYRLWRPVRRNPASAALGGVAALAAVAALGAWLLLGREREAAVRGMRDTAAGALEAALQLRRKGARPVELQPFLARVREGYEKAVARAPGSAEVEYLMGRMHRVVSHFREATDHQERALRHDPDFAPALYERALLSSIHYGSLLSGIPDEGRLEPAAKERARSLREGIVRDCERLEALLAQSRAAGVSRAHALAARGILQFRTGQWAQARRSLEEAVSADPHLEEAWDALGATLTQFFYEDMTVPEKERAARAVEACYSRALTFDRGYVRHLTGRFNVRVTFAEWLKSRRHDPLSWYRSAEEDLSSALEITSEQHLWVQRGELRLRLAECHEGKADASEASRYYGEAVKDFEQGRRGDPAWAARAQAGLDAARPKVNR